MIIIDSLELTNFRCHSRLKLNFKTGVTGIIGKNGAGKSSIVEALLFALTGELFGGKKSDAITVGCDDGEVSLAFTLNGKKGVIRRYLAGGSPQLVYDGQTKKKAGDVKELWDSMLQVGPEIISKVIIAKQGEIPLLFAGDSTIRERVFQKIFLVPNTERIRSVITKNYLKQLPPLLPVADVLGLQAQIKALTSRKKQIGNQLREITVLSDSEVKDIQTRLVFLQRCEQDLTTELTLHEEATIKTTQLDMLNVDITVLQDYIDEINHEDVKQKISMLEQHRELFFDRRKMEADLVELKKSAPDLDEIPLLETKIKALIVDTEEYTNQRIEKETRLSINRKQIKNLESLDTEDKCPTCSQHIAHPLELIESLEAANTQLTLELQEIGERIKQTLEDRTALVRQKDKLTDIEYELKLLTSSLQRLRKVDFDQEYLDTLQQLLAEYNSAYADLIGLKNRKAKLVSRLDVINEYLANLNKYDGGTSIKKEQELCANALIKNTEALRLRQSLEIDYRNVEFQINNFNAQIEEAKENAVKNKKRNRYSELLNIALDTLMTSNFPRKLILDYADVVSDYLQEKLQDFSIPYKAKVADNFKIEMYNEAGHKVPTISGGQQIQVGISLHLALHELFSQSFPLLVIDEGTTHLDEDNRAAYFDILKKLKTGKKIQQIFIIDHSPQLSEVVDQVIELSND